VGFDWTLALHSARRRLMLDNKEMIAAWRLGHPEDG
jgi:hypothetical protein